MNREIKTTSDGSKTLYISDLNENYHSHHGALQEAKHVFIKNGLNLKNNYEIHILELGFGTGLNAVSYTHLDVYKRQGYNLLKISPKRLKNYFLS